MNVETEQLDNRMARMTVVVESDRLDEARKSAARKIARQVRIPGFRKGRAPYRVLASHVGEAAILETAVEDLGMALYPDALGETGLDPYGPGTLEDFEQEPDPTFRYTLPLQPVTDLGDYRSIRREFAPPEVSDSDVDDALLALQEREALVEDSPRPVAAGNRVHATVTATVLDEEEGSEAAGEAAAGEADGEGDGEAAAGRQFMDGQQLVLSLTPQREPAPGFTEALLGAAGEEQRDFELQYPEDEDRHGTLSGKRVAFSVVVRKIELVTLPELNDDFAARVGAGDGEGDGDAEATSLLTLRVQTRERLNAEAGEQAMTAYAREVLETIIEGATFSWPEALVQDQMEHLLLRMDHDMRQRGLTLDDYIRMSGTTREALKEESRDNAEALIRHTLTMAELSRAEGIEISEAMLEEEIGRSIARFGDQAEAFRSMYDNEDMRQNLRNELQTRAVMERIAGIARGELADEDSPEADAEGETS
ncbi:MAG: trigger factor [Anaerolineaceae bacterium]|nr:trigger factor [Anaerolineaceae bacterium]MDE0329397.1 trigger factor [Anaerolineaceae bacterium]